MKRCTCCGASKSPALGTRQRPWVLPFLYGLMFECRCGSTQVVILWELPDELLLVDGELGPVSHDRDARETEAA